MKRNVRKPNGAKKPRKVARRTAAQIAAMDIARVTQAAKERSELLAEWELSTLFKLLSLGLESDHVPRKVNRSKREAGLTEPASLPVADAVGGEHPSALRADLTKLAQLVDYLMVLSKIDGGLLTRRATGQAELEARVALAEAALERLLHDTTQCLNLVHRSTPGASHRFPPVQKVPTHLPTYLTRDEHAALVKEIENGAPLDQDTGVSQGAVGVPLVKEAGNPLREEFTRAAAAYFAFLQRTSPLTERSRLSRFVRKCVAQVRRLLDACARRITEFDPPV